jgi:N-acetylglucosaminyl-diphospho-decaprenol L-rhamnosyltransferase
MSYDRAETEHARVDVIIVNWNAGRRLRECIESFSAVSRDAVTLDNIVVVDNASTDGSLPLLDHFFGTFPLKLIRNTENRGFAAACNQGAAGSTADFLLFLNPDTRLAAGCLENPVAFFNASENRVGIVGVQLVNTAGEITRSCAREPTPATMIGQSFGLDWILPSYFPPHLLFEWPHDVTRTVDQVMGAFFMIRRALFVSLGGFDERFFVYFEDLDLALRSRALGWISVYLPTAQAFHRGQGTTDAAKARRLFYFCRSKILFARKYFTRTEAIAVAATTLLIEPMTRTIAALITGRIGVVPDILRGFVMLWSDFPNMLGVLRDPRC